MNTKEKLLATQDFIDNEYLDKYVDLIDKNFSTDAVSKQTNKHHIIPAYYFRHFDLPIDNSDENLVNLYYRDHMLAHLYLSGCTEGRNRYWNLYSIFMMSGQRYLAADELEFLEKLPEYQTLYEQAISAAPNHRKGTTVSEETRQRMREASALRAAMNPSTKGRIWVNNGEVDKMIHPEDFEEYESLGFVAGRVFRHSEETRAAQSERSKGPRSKEFCEKMSVIAKETAKNRNPESYKKQGKSLSLYYADRPGTFKGKTHTEESKQKNREAHLGKVYITDGINDKVIDSSDVQKYLSTGLWREGASKGRTTGKIWVMRDNTNKLIQPEDLDAYLSQGYTRGKIGKTKGRVWMHKGDVRKMVKMEDVEKFKGDGFEFGYSC